MKKITIIVVVFLFGCQSVKRGDLLLGDGSGQILKAVVEVVDPADVKIANSPTGKVVTLSEAITENGCIGEDVVYRHVSHPGIKAKGFYLFAAIRGKARILGLYCIEVIMSKYIRYQDVLNLVGIDTKKTHHSAIYFERWHGDHGFIGTHADYHILFTEINKDQIKVRLLAKDEKTTDKSAK